MCTSADATKRVTVKCFIDHGDLTIDQGLEIHWCLVLSREIVVAVEALERYAFAIQLLDMLAL